MKHSCYDCKYHENFGQMVGCSYKRKIILDPDQLHDCHEVVVNEKIRDMIDRLFQDLKVAAHG